MLGLFAQQGPEQGRSPVLMKWRWNSMFRWIFLLLLCRENKTAICQSGCNLEVNKLKKCARMIGTEGAKLALSYTREDS